MSEATPFPTGGNPLLANPLFQQNPYALYGMLRESNPVFRPPVPIETGAGIFVLTRHADVEAALRDKHMSAQRQRADVFRRYADQLPAAILQGGPISGSMLIQDPPEHTRLRGLVNKAFTPRRIEALRPRIEALVAGLLDGIGDGGELDVIHDLAEPLPAIVIAELLGVPAEDHRRFRQWSQTLIDGLPDWSPEGRARAEETVQVLVDYLGGQIDERRRTPRDDLLSALIAARDQRDALSEAELVSTSLLLLLAGHETTTNLIGNGTLAFLRNPGEWDRLRAEPGLLDNAVEELLRFDSPVQATVRVPTETVELGGQAIEPGAVVVCGIGAANRDPEVHPDPDRLDIGRSDIRHLSFGLGTHFCLGASLARLEGRAFFAALRDRFAKLELACAEEELAYRSNPILRGLKALPVRAAA